MKNMIIGIFGSSIMEGIIGVEPDERWYEIMRSRLTRRFPDICFAVVNGAVGGESTRECMLRFDRDVLAYSPDYLLVMVGGNNEDHTRPERIVPLDELRRHMDDMMARLPEKTGVIGVGLGPVINERHWAAAHPAFAEPFRQCGGGLDELLEPQRRQAREFFEARNCPFLDLYPLLVSCQAQICNKDKLDLRGDFFQEDEGRCGHRPRNLENKSTGKTLAAGRLQSSALASNPPETFDSPLSAVPANSNQTRNLRNPCYKFELDRTLGGRRHDYLLPDGIHLNSAGHKLFGDEMFSVMENELLRRNMTT